MAKGSEPLLNGLENAVLFGVLARVTKKHSSFWQVTEDLPEIVAVGKRACRNDSNIIKLCSSNCSWRSGEPII